MWYCLGCGFISIERIDICPICGSHEIYQEEVVENPEEGVKK